MPALSDRRARPGRRPAAAAGWRLVALTLLTLVGIVAMHHLGGVASAKGHGHHAGQATQAHAATEACEHHDGGCPQDHHGGPGQVCQASSPNTGAAIPAASDTSVLGPVTPYRAAASPVTAALDAPGGSGCGPPSLTMLSIFRT